jgi:hypothetical protein
MDYVAQIGFAMILAIPVACVVWTFTQEEVFREAREGLKRYCAEHRRPWCWRKLAYLPTCPYCLSQYVGAVFVALFHFHMLADDWRGYVVSLFSLVMIANVYITIYNLLRVSLRAAKARADGAEAYAANLRQQHFPSVTKAAQPTATRRGSQVWPETINHQQHDRTFVPHARGTAGRGAGFGTAGSF